MTITEILKAKGVGEDVIKAVLDDMKANKIFTASEENLDIRFGKVKTELESVTKERDEGKALIAELQKSNKGNEALQKQVAEYETKMVQIQAELEQTKLDAAIKVELLASKAVDVDYLTFKLKGKGDELALDENGKIKGWEDKLAALKTQFPTQFETDSKKNIIENKLPNEPGDHDGISKEAFAKMGYQERLKVYQDNPDAYKQLTQG